MPLTPKPVIPVWYWPDRQIKPDRFWNDFERAQVANAIKELQEWEEQEKRERGELPPKPPHPGAPPPAPIPTTVGDK